MLGILSLFFPGLCSCSGVGQGLQCHLCTLPSQYAALLSLQFVASPWTHQLLVSAKHVGQRFLLFPCHLLGTGLLLLLFFHVGAPRTVGGVLKGQRKSQVLIGSALRRKGEGFLATLGSLKPAEALAISQAWPRRREICILFSFFCILFPTSGPSCPNGESDV